MRSSGDIFRMFVAWCLVGPGAGALAYSVIFGLPMIFGQSSESMIMWGWITTLPALAGALFAAGYACTALLAYWNLCPKWRSPFFAGCMIAAVANGLLFLLAMLGL